MQAFFLRWKITYRHNVLGTNLVAPEEAEYHENYVKEVGQYRCPHEAQEVEHLSLDNGYLKVNTHTHMQSHISTNRGKTSRPTIDI